MGFLILYNVPDRITGRLLARNEIWIILQRAVTEMLGKPISLRHRAEIRIVQASKETRSDPIRIPIANRAKPIHRNRTSNNDANITS
jgi:hypothetical protein